MSGKHAVIFGAGKIARAFISHLLTLSGYHITFVEKSPELVALLRERKQYKVQILGAPEKNIVIKNFQPIENRHDKGVLYENFVASEIVKNELDIKYWRTKSKAEVDFILEKKGELIPIEVKSTLIGPKSSKSFLSFLDKYKPSTSIILSESLFAEKRNIKFRPIFSISREI